MSAILLQKQAHGSDQAVREIPGSTRLLRGYLHKTSNSLCGIKGYAGLISARCDQGDATENWAQKILSEVERLEDLLRQVGDLTSPNSAHCAGHDLAGVIRDVIAETGAEYPGLHTVVRNVGNPELLLPEADLRLVLKEILKNSAQSCGRVLVEITSQEEITGRVTLRLADNGPGMDPALLKMAADPFVSTRDGHHGVGLTRVETLCEMHGLAWSLASHLETGTTVTLEVGRGLTPDLESMDRRQKG